MLGQRLDHERALAAAGWGRSAPRAPLARRSSRRCRGRAPGGPQRRPRRRPNSRSMRLSARASRRARDRFRPARPRWRNRARLRRCALLSRSRGVEQAEVGRAERLPPRPPAAAARSGRAAGSTRWRWRRGALRAHTAARLGQANGVRQPRRPVPDPAGRSAARLPLVPAAGALREQLPRRASRLVECAGAGFGDPEAWLAIVGLAPGKHGARTAPAGRSPAIMRASFSTRPAEVRPGRRRVSRRSGDGLRLKGASSSTRSNAFRRPTSRSRARSPPAAIISKRRSPHCRRCGCCSRSARSPMSPRAELGLAPSAHQVRAQISSTSRP
jgi:hypothetical protein